jgi:hypothetical protein
MRDDPGQALPRRQSLPKPCPRVTLRKSVEVVREAQVGVVPN